MAAGLAAAFWQEGQRRRPVGRTRFSQIKPVFRPSPKTFLAIESFLKQNEVPPHDVYLCSADAAPAQWLSEHPQATWLQLRADQSQNGKAATLALGSTYWSGEVFVITDADMWAPPDYLRHVIAEFADPKVGVTTCLYRSTPPALGDWCHLFEALCILDFSASVLVARRTEGIRFAMGSTMAVRRETLRDIGGFEALTPYLADDYQLGHRAHKAGWKIALAPVVLETEPPQGQLSKALSHQYRWLVTSRVSRPGGHLAFIITQGFLWATLLMIVHPSWGTYAMGAWCSLRMVCGWKTHRDLGGRAGGAWQVLFLPWKDMLYLVLWTASLWGNSVKWGHRQLTIDCEGKIVS